MQPQPPCRLLISAYQAQVTGQQQRDQDLLTSQSQELHQLQQMMGIQVQGQAPTQQSALGQLLQMIQPASSEVPPPSTTALSLPQSTADLPFSPHRD